MCFFKDCVKLVNDRLPDINLGGAQMNYMGSDYHKQYSCLLIHHIRNVNLNHICGVNPWKIVGNFFKKSLDFEKKGCKISRNRKENLF